MLDRASRFSLQGKRAQADLGTVEGPRTAGARAIELVGTVDILVNNAGVFHLHRGVQQDFICGQVVFIDGGYSAV
jgi:NAD(P)-dependent dehydrogenase (short-subunit alcohol dehydrogenase family)